MKIARQSKACVRMPPSAGPTARPKVPTIVHRRAPRTGSDPARSSAAPIPCTERAAIRNARLSDTAQQIEATRNTTRPAASSRPA
jgi:hypothetical protein